MIHQGQTPNLRSFFLLVGAGRLARHFSFAFQSFGLPLLRWDRSRPKDELQKLLAQATHVGLAISDDALEGFMREHLGSRHTVVHFSGAKNIPGAIAAHPLMTFGPALFAPEEYERLHFAITGASRLEDALPGWPNSFTVMPAEERARYHALCVMAGNFPQLIWKKCEADLAVLGIPADAFRRYVEVVATNFSQFGPAAVTGPIVRGDQGTIALNREALSGDKWQQVYESITEAHA